MQDSPEATRPVPSQPAELIDALLALLASPRQPDFYAHYAALVRALCRAEAAVVLRLDGAEPAPLGGAGSPADQAFLAGQLDSARWQQALAQGYGHETVRKSDGLGLVLLLVPLLDTVPVALLLGLPERERAHVKEALVRALLVKDLRPAATGVAESTSLPAGTGAPTDLLDDLALATEVMQAPRFGAAALALVNGAVRNLGLRQAALCWRHAAEAELVAVSHLDKFEKTSRLVQALQTAAQEVLATDRVQQATRAGDAPQGPPAHLALLDAFDGVGQVISLPLRDGSGQTQAVLIGLNEGEPLAPQHLNQTLLMLELVYPRLADARLRHGSWWRRARHAALHGLERVLGPGRPWAKALAVLASVLLLVLLFGRMPYSFEASAQLTTDSTRILTSQNDGRLQEVLVDVGDLVQAGQPMARLDTTDLRQQEAEVLSDIRRFQAEEDKARAAGALADVQVAQMRREQSQARLKRLAHLLEQAQTEAPFEGVVVEGERRSLQGASVRRGDKLFRVAQVRDLYLMLQVPERDIRDVSADAQGRLVLLSQPGQEIRFQVASFVPMAQVKGEEGNHFLLKAQLLDPVAPWWRPGMTGLAKIDVGSRNIGWVLLHPVIDRLRLWLWW